MSASAGGDGPFADAAPHRTPRPVFDRDRGHAAAGLGAGPAPRRPGSEHGDPPWAGGGPIGSSDEHLIRNQRPLHGPGNAGSPGLGPRGPVAGPGNPGFPSRFPEHTPADPPHRTTSASPPWMWIAIVGVLALAIAIGVVLAMK
jgi:hypothetical protein